ncbi:uncharacterized protein LOC133206181 [Saccostrea echinata]|uniref:uncharacterized protein LOC133206181 n=1 Tax=Saccostrea echinata TaxID=191078 RepID=UPI002A7F3396|nr:uncharacterized protein LOC133206181 [Saccostrea echinata]
MRGAVLGLALLPLILGLQSHHFDHDVDVKHPESGEHVKLRSKGRLSETIDLDRVSGIKRVICQDQKILIAVEHKGIGRNWKKGQVVMGSPKWDCTLNTLPGSPSKQRGVYAKIKEIFFPTETGVVLHTQSVRAFDVIDEADIKFRYTPGNSASHPPETRRRHRRYIANVLSELLGNITWQYSDTTSIPWNKDDSGEIGSFGLAIGENDTDYRYTENVTNNDVMSFVCEDCSGTSHMSYEFDLIIKKNAMNEPEIHRYLNKLESNTTINLKSSFQTSKDIKLELHKEMEELRVPPTMLFSVPLAHVRNLPPVMLTVKYTGSTHVDLHVDTRSAVSMETDIEVGGKYSFVHEYSGTSALGGDVVPHNWTSTTHRNTVNGDKDMSVNVSVYQQILFNTTIGWFARDMEIDFSPPINYKLKPTIRGKSAVNDAQRCTTKSADLSGEFNVTEARLTVEAFGVSIWNSLIAKGFNKKVSFENDTLYQKCSADCPISTKTSLYDGLAMSDVVGNPRMSISRKDPDFRILTQMWGDNVLFSSEEANVSSWCGAPGRPCGRCVYRGADDINQACADRLMVPKLATKISRLGKYVSAEWPDKKLVVVEAWDEPTSSNPHGRHGDESLYYEGRAAQLALTYASNNFSVSPPVIKDDKDNKRLEQMAICSGFQYVSKVNIEAGIEVAVGEKQAPTSEVKRTKKVSLTGKDAADKAAMVNAMRRLGSILPGKKCPDFGLLKLESGASFPSKYHGEVEAAVGPPLGQIHRENSEEMNKLYEYQFDDFEFLHERRENQTDEQCGTMRKCQDGSFSNAEDPWSWSANRVMAPRLAFRMRRLALIAKDELQGLNITVERAFADKVDRQESKLFLEGRGARLTVKENPNVTIPILGHAAICAGFDFVRNVDNVAIEVFVKLQDGFRTTLIPYHSGEVLIAVAPPSSEEGEYSYSAEFDHENKKPLLVDGAREEIKLSKHFKIGDFKFEGHRFLRIDPSLVECLELTQQDFRGKIQILTGYRPKSANEQEVAWNRRQLARFQMGQAAEIMPRSDDEVLNLAKMLMVTCTPFLRLQRRGLGVHVKQLEEIGKNSIHVDLYPLRDDNRIIDLKINSKINKETECMWNELKLYWSEITKGGPGIIPYDTKSACKKPDLEKKTYLNFNLNRPGFCLQFHDKKFCQNSTKAREELGDELLKQLQSVAGTDRLDITTTREQIKQCIVTGCGGCSGSGKKWDGKVRVCSELVDNFMEHASIPLLKPTESMSFFNPDNVESASHAYACKKDGTKCQETVQLYSIFQTLLAKTYKPNPNTSIEEEVFGATDNPSPLLQIVEQEIAMNVSGNVSVVIDRYKDISALRSVLKVLMIHNRKVNFVNFHVMHGVNPDKIVTTLQRKLETWSGLSCPKWSRFAASPFTIEVISKERKKRSIEDSRQRNEARKRKRDWERDWILRT